VIDTIVVFAGGPKPSRRAFAAIPPGAQVIAADGGAEHALAHGLLVETAVGDFDSISPAAFAELERAGVRIERHPPEKDATDLELALATAVEREPRRVLVVGGAGGRLDHLLGELTLLGADAYAGVELDAVFDRATAHVVRSERRLAGCPGELISLLPLHGPAMGVETEGLRYELHGETLDVGSSRGISNEFRAELARIALTSGVLLAIRPG
jgi:thiamine pyrophosphokinase